MVRELASHRRVLSGVTHKELKMTSRIGSGKAAADYFDDLTLDTSYSQFLKVLGSTEPDFSVFINDMSFAGFNKQRMAVLAANRLGARRTLKLTILAAYRGTNLGKIVGRSIKVDPDVKKAFDERLILSNGKGPDDLTMGRLLACFPQFAAYYLMKLNCPKKVEGLRCPACIQFPAAASLPMSPLVRQQHIEFCIDFSKLIGSKFDVKFYSAAFKSQEKVSTLHEDLLKVLGNPTDQESMQVDVFAVASATGESLALVPTSSGGVTLGR